MEPLANQPAANNESPVNQPSCDCCDGQHNAGGMGSGRMKRRDFLTTASGIALGASALGSVLPAGRAWAEAKPAATAAVTAAAKSEPESLVKMLYGTLSPKQREKICFAWDHKDEDRGLLRTRVENNWDITSYYLNDDAFYTKDQQAMVRQIFEGIISPEWHERIYKQLDDDSGGYGEQNSIAIFGDPGSDKFEFVLTGRHMTIRCDGNSADHVAFGGPIFYGHAAETFNESKNHKGNVFWPQALAANKLYQMLDSKQQEQALLKTGLPKEQKSGFRKKAAEIPGLSVEELSNDQKEHLQKVVTALVEPYRQSDRDEVSKCLKAQGGLDKCNLIYYAQGDIGEDRVWDNWRLEGPSFVWHYRGAPHVHVWVNVADDPSVKLNA